MPAPITYKSFFTKLTAQTPPAVAILIVVAILDMVGLALVGTSIILVLEAAFIGLIGLSTEAAMTVGHVGMVGFISSIVLAWQHKLNFHEKDDAVPTPPASGDAADG